MKNVIIALLLTASCFAQTTTKKPAVKPQSSCSVALKATSQAVDSMSAELATLRIENEKLKKDNQELAAKNAESDKKFADLRDAAMTVYNESVQIGQAYRKTVDDNTALTNKYNYLLADAKEQMQRANDALARMNAQYAKQQNFANALAVYAIMPKPQPYVLPQPVAPQSLNINCTSNSLGSTTYTNCH